jgi:ribose-phosphate pyrophosphokinase
MNIIGDIEGRICLLFDDIVDSAGTLCNAADALVEQGATAAYAYVTHGVLSGGAIQRVESSHLETLTVTDSIQPTEAMKSMPSLRTVTIAPLIGEAIRRISEESSVSSLFD